MPLAGLPWWTIGTADERRQDGNVACSFQAYKSQLGTASYCQQVFTGFKRKGSIFVIFPFKLYAIPYFIWNVRFCRRLEMWTLWQMSNRLLRAIQWWTVCRYSHHCSIRCSLVVSAAYPVLPASVCKAEACPMWKVPVYQQCCSSNSGLAAISHHR